MVGMPFHLESSIQKKIQLFMLEQRILKSAKWLAESS